MNLMTTHALLASAEKVRSLKPKVQFDVAGLEADETFIGRKEGTIKRRGPFKFIRNLFFGPSKIF
jgi:hypothetical protein